MKKTTLATMVLAACVGLLVCLCIVSSCSSSDSSGANNGVVATDTVEVVASRYASAATWAHKYEQIDLLFSNSKALKLYREVTAESGWAKKENPDDPFLADKPHVCIIGYTPKNEVVFMRNLTLEGSIKK